MFSVKYLDVIQKKPPIYYYFLASLYSRDSFEFFTSQRVKARLTRGWGEGGGERAVGGGG